MKETIVNRLMKLLCVKSVVTILLSVVFAIMALRGVISADQFLTVFSVVVAFYFGTQAKKDTATTGTTAATETTAAANDTTADTIEARVRTLEEKSEAWDSVVAVVNEGAEIANV